MNIHQLLYRRAMAYDTLMDYVGGHVSDTAPDVAVVALFLSEAKQLEIPNYVFGTQDN